MIFAKSLFFLAIFAATSPVAHARAKTPADPYANVESLELKNGIKAYLAHSSSADTAYIRIVVKAGQNDDPIGKSGVAHLLEHYLLAHPALAKDSTVMEQIEEIGGTSNGVTRYDETVYFATVPKEHASWLIETYGRILSRNSFTKSETEKAKKPVFIEIGKPSLWHQLFGWSHGIIPDLKSMNNFWGREFGLSVEEPNHAVEADKVDTFQITETDLKNFYRDNYVSGKITVFLAGNFPQKEASNLLQKAFSPIASSGHSTESPEPGSPKMRPYQRVSIASGSPRISFGAKVASISDTETQVASIYLPHLAYRLMKVLRNNKGNTYSVNEFVNKRKGHAVVGIRFDAAESSYAESFAFARDLIIAEASKGGISEAQFMEAKQMAAKRKQLREKDADSMMYLARELADFRRNYPSSKYSSPYQAFLAVDFDTYKSSLRRMFDPEMEYEVRAEPPLLFRFDPLVFVAISLIAWLAIIRVGMKTRFPNASVKLVRNLRYPSFYLVPVFCAATTYAIYTLASPIIRFFWAESGLEGMPLFFSHYLPSVIHTGLFVATYQFLASSLGQKVLIVENSLWVKSFGYRSNVYDLGKLASIELIHPLKLHSSVKLLWKLKFSFYQYPELAFWRKGILLRFTDGRCAFLAITQPEKAILEIQQSVPKRGEAESPLKLAA